MFSTLRNRFGIPGVISVIALVFAMFGGAYAATSSSGGGKATASAKAKKGPRGPKGATGPAGPAGPQGPAGANGKDGANGTNGTNGAPGAAGESVTVTPIASPGCEGRAGAKFKNATGEAKACNGANGQTGFTETLPPGKTETGVWAFGYTPNGWQNLRLPISFTIPLAAELTSTGCGTLEPGPPSHVPATCHVHFINQAGHEVTSYFVQTLAGSTVCTGTAAAPTAPPGNLCVYAARLGVPEETEGSDSSHIILTGGSETNGASVSGAILTFGQVHEEAQVWGTWAVTAEE